MSGESERKRGEGRERGSANAGSRPQGRSGQWVHRKPTGASLGTARNMTAYCKSKTHALYARQVKTGSKDALLEIYVPPSAGAPTWLLMQSLSHAGVTMGTPPRAMADCMCACMHKCMLVRRIHVACACAFMHSSTHNPGRQTDRQGEPSISSHACSSAQGRDGQCSAGQCACGQRRRPATEERNGHQEVTRSLDFGGDQVGAIPSTLGDDRSFTLQPGHELLISLLGLLCAVVNVLSP